MRRHIIILALTFLAICTSAQELTKNEIRTVVTEVIKKLDDEFIIPDLKEELVEKLSKRLSNGDYDLLKSQSQLAKTLTEQMQEISDDRHLYILENKSSNNDNPQPQRRMVRAGMDGVQFDDVISFEVLDGNIGYISTTMLPSLNLNEEKYRAIVEKASKTDALIVDATKCRGGDGNAVAYIMGSYMEEKKLLTTYYSKQGSMELWSIPSNLSKQNANKDVFVLTSKATGSAGEAMAFYPQQLGRISVVGEQSSGAGRSNQIFDISHGFKISVSTRTSVAPNGRQFQGIGVEPDIPTVPSQAKTQAHLLALKGLKEKAPKKTEDYSKIIKNISENPANASKAELPAEVRNGIETAVLGYIENFFLNNYDEMLKYLHPELAKGGVSKKRGEETFFYEGMSMDRLKGMLEKNEPLALSAQKNSVEILDVFQNSATVKLDTGYPDRMKWIEYIILSKIDGQWKINHIMWDYYPMRRMRRRQG